MLHRRYADGTPRPLCRGALHGCTATVSWLLLASHWNDVRTEVLPTVLALLWTLTFSSLLHLYPWSSALTENYICRMDRVGIIWITMASIGLTPLLVEDERCRPALAFTVLTNAVPNLISAASVLRGSTVSPNFIWSVALSNLACAAHWATIDARFVAMSVAICTTYCAGFWFYSTQFDFGRPVHAKYWGYHEHMHVFITIAFVMHAAAIHFFVSECTMPRPSAEP